MQYVETTLRSNTYRAISTQYPPIDLFENLCTPEQYDQACKWEMLTNPRMRNTLIPHEDCVFGNGASYVMAPFFYKTPPARFSTDLFGGYYATKNEITAIFEKAYHLGNFISATENEPFYEGLVLLILKNSINIKLHDLTKLSDKHPIYDKNSYHAAQKTAIELKEINSNGVLFNSVRKQGGHCLAIFKPKNVKIPIATKKIPVHFDGQKIDKFFDNEKWQMIDSPI